jgi:tetratricopeptide (TPR) repeat protein
MNGPAVGARRHIDKLALCLLVGASACVSSSRVTRVADGRRIEGRYIDDEAYAAYVNGVVLETQGRLDAARVAYERALLYDDKSPELWTRLGALRCRRPPANGSAATPAPVRGDPWEAFARAAEIDPTYEETYTERSRCHLARGELVAAVTDAETAVSLDPDRTEAVLALAMALERQGRLADAKRWIVGLVVREPDSRDAQEAALAFAARTKNEALGEAARRALAELDSKKVAPSRADVDAALRRGDLEAARRIAVATRVSSGALALRAAALGNVPFARAESDLVLGADPADSDARIAAIAAADLARDDVALARALSNWPADIMPISTLGALLMSEVLRRRIGDDAARAVRAFAGAAETSDDPLVRAVAARK